MLMQELNEIFLKYPVLVGIVTGAIAGLIGSFSGVFSTWINVLYQNKREKQQKVREEIQKQHIECISQLSWFKTNIKLNDFNELIKKHETLTTSIDILSIYYMNNQNIFINVKSIKEKLDSKIYSLFELTNMMSESAKEHSKLLFKLKTTSDNSEKIRLKLENSEYYSAYTIQVQSRGEKVTDLKTIVNDLTNEIIKVASRDFRLH
jgi:hypothetical protein